MFQSVSIDGAVRGILRKLKDVFTTHCICYKNVKYMGFSSYCVWAACLEYLNGGLCFTCEALLQARYLCVSSFKEIPVIKRYKKRLWSNVFQESKENDWKIRRMKFFWSEICGGWKSVVSMSLEDVAIALQEETSSGMQRCS